MKPPRAVKDQPGFRPGHPWMVAISKKGGPRLYVLVGSRYMDASLKDDPRLTRYVGRSS
jgi:hypothetical protein